MPTISNEEESSGGSPSARREWIEMISLAHTGSMPHVSLREEGVD